MLSVVLSYVCSLSLPAISYTFTSFLVFISAFILSISKNKNGWRVLSLRLFYFWREWDLKKKRTFNRKGYSNITSSLWHVSQTTKGTTNARFYTIHECLKYWFVGKNYFRKCLIVFELVVELEVDGSEINSSKNNCSKEVVVLKTNILKVNTSEVNC